MPCCGRGCSRCLRRGRRVAQVAAAMGEPIEAAMTLLYKLEAEGLAVRGPAGWRLTDAAEAKYGQALRDWELVEERAAA